jgi:hypothetical protein
MGTLGTLQSHNPVLEHTHGTSIAAPPEQFGMLTTPEQFRPGATLQGLPGSTSP